MLDRPAPRPIKQDELGLEIPTFLRRMKENDTDGIPRPATRNDALIPLYYWCSAVLIGLLSCLLPGITAGIATTIATAYLIAIHYTLNRNNYLGWEIWGLLWCHVFSVTCLFLISAAPAGWLLPALASYATIMGCKMWWFDQPLSKEPREFTHLQHRLATDQATMPEYHARFDLMWLWPILVATFTPTVLRWIYS